MKEQKKISLESLVSEIEKNGRIGRLGKVFKTEKNYYFYDTGTGKVAKLNSNVYIVLKSLLEGMPVEDIKNLQLSKSEFEDAISEIKSAMENEHILQAPPLKTLTGDAVTELDDILENKVENVTLEVMVNGTGSFEKTVMGAKKLFEAFHKEGKSSKIGFNMVVSGPGYLEQYTKIQEFIEKSEWIPKDVMILTATVDHGPSESD